MKSNEFLKKVEQLKSVQKKSNKLITRFCRSEPIIIGTISQIKRSCGNPNCICAKGQGHPVWTLLTKYKQKRRCQVVRKNDVLVVKEKIEEYRKLKDYLREIRDLDSVRDSLLREVIRLKNELYK